MPSFGDAHSHPSAAVSFLYAANLYGLGSLQGTWTAVSAFATANPTLASIQGNGWSEALFPGIGPLQADLDSAVSDRPVALWSDGHHSLWVNSAALTLAGITTRRRTRSAASSRGSPARSRLTRSSPACHPGLLRESATDMMMAVFPDFTVEQYIDGIMFFQSDIANPVGITLVQDAVLIPGSNAAVAYEELAKSGELTLRVRGSLQVYPNQGDSHRKSTPHVAERALHKTHLLQDQRREVLRRRRHRGPHRLPARGLRRPRSRAPLPRRTHLAAAGPQHGHDEGRQGRHADPRARHRRRRRRAKAWMRSPTPRPSTDRVTVGR